MTRLTKYEKETIILFNEGEDTANIYTPTMPDFESVWQHLAKSTPTCADWKKIVNKVE